MSALRYPALDQIHTRVWLTALSHKLGRLATLDAMPDAEKEGPNGHATHAHPSGLAAFGVSRRR
jgi:hypothetical protein